MKKILIATLLLMCFQVSLAGQNLKFGVAITSNKTYSTVAQRTQIYRNLIAQLSVAMHRKIVFVPFKTHHELYQAIQRKRIDIAYLPGGIYAKSVLDKEGLRPVIVVLTEKNGRMSDHYSSYLLTNNFKIHSLKDLKNKTFGFNDAYMSLSGLVYPMDYFVMHDMKPKTYFKEVKFFDGHGAALQGLNSKKVAAIAIWGDLLKNKNRNNYRILKTIHGLPNPCVVTTSNVSAKQRQSLLQGFLFIPGSHFRGLPFQSVEKAPANFYDQAISKVKLMLKYNNKLTRI